MSINRRQLLQSAAGLALAVSRGLRKLDAVLSRVPLVRRLSWYVMLEAGPAEPGATSGGR